MFYPEHAGLSYDCGVTALIVVGQCYKGGLPVLSNGCIEADMTVCNVA